MRAFQSAIDDCKLHDVRLIRDPFTWHRGQISERLDRGLVIDAWVTLFLHVVLKYMEYNHSEHRPLCVISEYYNQTKHQTMANKKGLRHGGYFFNTTILEALGKFGADQGVTCIYEKLNKMHVEFHDWDQGC